MDFLKTLLAYMTLMATLGIQEGPAPQSVPTPTPLPPHITATPLPNQTAAPTATPGPSAGPTPAMTANKRYTQLEFGDSGSGVKNLQNALIKLGYMPKNSADGKYGYQTYNAVKDFQQANGLKVDGVAGPMTLTALYENPSIVGVSTETPVPTATPTPSLPPLPTPDIAYTPDDTSDTGSATVTNDVPTTEVKAAVTMAPVQPVALTRLEGAHIISGNDGKSLYVESEVDGVPALVRPDLWLNESGAAVVSLAQLADCLESWSLMGSSSDGLYALNASGYVVSIHLKADGPSVLVDGETAHVAAADVFIQDDVLYATDAFLRTVLKAETVFDVDEKSLVLFLQDKSIANAQD